MYSSSVSVWFRLFITAMLAQACQTVVVYTPSTTTTTAGSTVQPTCPRNCVCASYLKCSDLGEQSRVPDLTAAQSKPFQNVTFIGRTKIRTIQSRAFSGLGLRVFSLLLSGLGVRHIERGAFLGLGMIKFLDAIDVSRNHISGFVDLGTFAVDHPVLSLNICCNDIESLSSNALQSATNSLLRYLNLAHNRLTVLPDRVFANLTWLKDLYLNGNRLTSLTSSLFKDLSRLRRLNLANNRISYIHQSVFNSLSELDQLWLENNELSFLPALVFNRLNSLRSLTLHGNRLSAIHSIDLPAYSNLLTLNLNRNRIVNLTQVEISGLTSLKTLMLAVNRVTVIPVGYFAGFGSVEVLDLNGNNISGTLSASSLEGLTSMTLLNLSSNNINRISTRTFGASLRTLDLSDNLGIKYLPRGVFGNAENLTNLYMRKCRLTWTSRGVFNNLTLLENIDLSDNFISRVSSSSFENLPSLGHIDLSKNNIYAITANAFVDTSRLSNVSLDENRLSKVPVDIMSNLSNLRSLMLAHNSIGKLHALLQLQSVNVLNLTGNSISDIVDGAFNRTPQIRELYLDENQLTRIKLLMFSGLRYLTHLDLSDNLISTIDVGSFLSMSRLVYLSLRGNQLTSLEPETFIHLYSIRILDISANRLVSHIAEAVQRLYPLQELILDDNDITSFDVNLLANSEQALRLLSLRRNRISQLQFNNDFQFSFSFLDLGENQITGEIFDGLSRMRFLKTLKLDGNDIDSVPTVGKLNVTLTELDLSNNGLTDNSLATVVQLRRLRQLRLDGNFITDLSAADWSQLAHSLQVLSLSNNRLTSLNQIDKLWSLTQLNVDNNRITSIPDAMFQTLYDLKVLSMRDNQMTTIGQSTLDGLEQTCTHLDLSSNFISHVHSKAFYRLKNIKHLNLSNNAIRELVLPPIMNRLSELLLSNNRLTRFPDGLRHMRSITVLSMRNNTIESLPALDIGNKFGVKLVDLSRNQLREVDQVRFVGLLNVVNVGENELADTGAATWADVTFIEQLNLSNNALRRLPAGVTLIIDRIAHLYADRCSLTSLDDWVVAKSPLLTRLVELSLSGNRLMALPKSVIASVSTSLKRLDIRGNLFTTLDPDVFYGRASPYNLRRLWLAGNPWLCNCQLAWLRHVNFQLDNATCWTPSTTTHQHVACYNISDCPVPDYEEEYLDYPNEDKFVCETTTPTDAGPVVSNVWPLFGPQAGGTLVTVTGSELTDYQQPTIVFFSSNSDYFVTLLTNVTKKYKAPNRRYESKIMGKTPASNTTGEQLLVVVQYMDQSPINTTRLFVYRPNPDVIDIFPLSHLLRLAAYLNVALTSQGSAATYVRCGGSGGTAVTVIGDNVDAAAQPIITATVVITRFNYTDDQDDVQRRQRRDAGTVSQMTVTSEPCTVKNSSIMTCTMPEVRLPNGFQVVDDDVDNDQDMSVKAGGSVVSLKGRLDNNAPAMADIYIGLQFDGYGDYANLTDAIPEIKMEFYQPPTFDTSTNIIKYRPESDNDIDITGKNLQRGVRKSDYRVVIGNAECDVSFLSDNLLTCRPPYEEPKLFFDDPLCDDVNSILIHVGKAGPFLYACIQYEIDAEVDIALIIGITVGLGVPLIILIIVTVVCVYKWRKEKKQTANNKSLHMEMSPDVIQLGAYPPEDTKTTDNQQKSATESKTHKTQKDAPVNDAGGYIDLIHDDNDSHYVKPPTATTENSGYLILLENDTPGPLSYMVPLPSPPSSDKEPVKQEPTSADAKSLGADSAGYMTPYEGHNANNEHYLGLSVKNNPSDAYTPLYLEEVGSSNTDSVRVSSPPEGPLSADANPSGCIVLEKDSPGPLSYVVPLPSPSSSDKEPVKEEQTCADPKSPGADSAGYLTLCQ